MPYLIQTPRLRLRELDTRCDADVMLELLNQPGFIAGIADHGLRTPAQATVYLDSWGGMQYRRDGFGHYALELRDSGAFIGTAGLICKPELPHPHLGYALLDRHAGQGYAREAVRALMAHAPGLWGLTMLCAIVSPDNASSLRLLSDVGFHDHGMRELDAGAMTVRYLTASLDTGSTG